MKKRGKICYELQSALVIKNVGDFMKYVPEAFRYRVRNYLLKPLEYDMFQYEVKQYLVECDRQNKDFLLMEEKLCCLYIL